MKKLFFFVMTLSFITLFSCERENPQKTVVFNIEEFNTKKSIWNNLELKNYSFTYYFDGYMPEYIVGNTIVENGNSIVDVRYTDDSENFIENNSKYYIDNIERIFEILISEYNQALEDVNEKLYDSVLFQCKYNKTYGYPEYISISYEGGSDYKKNKDGSLVGSTNNIFTFRLKDFSSKE